MKKTLAIMLAVLSLTASIVGCGGKESATEATTSAQTTTETEKQDSVETEAPVEETTKAVEPLDLTGLWVQENPAEESYMAAEIKEEGVIGVFFVIQGDDTPWTYWVGTYDAPTDDKDKYSWVSESTYSGNGLLASSDSTKKFSYKDGKLSYPISIQGKSGTLTLVRGDWDTSNIPDSAFGSVKASQVDLKPLEIKDSQWFVKDGKWLYYYVTLHNPNEDIAIDLPSFRITARDANGVLLGTEDQTLSIIYPGQDFTHGVQAFSVDEVPEIVEFEVLEPEEYNLKKASVLDEYIPLEVVNAGARSDKVMGEISNPNSYDIDSAIVVAICKNKAGEIIDINTTFVDDVKAGTNTPFSMSSYVDDEIDSIECYANQW